MRKYIVLIMLSLCSIGVSAQSEAMTVDNQMPGWLSSKIAYRVSRILVGIGK